MNAQKYLLNDLRISGLYLKEIARTATELKLPLKDRPRLLPNLQPYSLSVCLSKQTQINQPTNCLLNVVIPLAWAERTAGLPEGKKYSEIYTHPTLQYSSTLSIQNWSSVYSSFALQSLSTSPSCSSSASDERQRPSHSWPHFFPAL